MIRSSRDKDVQRLLDESVENELIPVDSWAAFAEKGGVAGVISLLPLKEIIGVITHMAFYSGWPTAMEAAQIATEVFGRYR